MESLLGQFYHRIKGSQEDIASEGLAYILNRSLSVNRALLKFIKNNCDLSFSELSYSVQSIGENLERPDISGYDMKEREVLTIEAKFWATLTDNQPIGYLERLDNTSVLMMLCPSLRLKTLASEVRMRLKHAGYSVNEPPNDLDVIRFKLDNEKNVLLTTWTKVLTIVRFQLVQDNEQALLSDIDQIIGLCNLIDRNSFLPIQSEDLSPSVPKKMSAYYDLADKIIDEFKNENFAHTNGLRSTPQRDGYTRFFVAGELGAALEISFSLWSQKADTPFWLRIALPTSNLWEWNNPELKAACRKVALSLDYASADSPGGSFHYALYPKIGTTEDKVIEDLKSQIKTIIQSVAEHQKSH